MKIKNIEHVDQFGMREYICWAEVTEVPEEFVVQAKEIDGENYCEGCFGICVGHDENGWYVCQDYPSSELFYVDNDGDKRWMSYKLTEEEEIEAIKFCRKYIEQE